MPSFFADLLDNAVKTMSQGGNIRLAVMHGSVAAGIMLLASMGLTYFTELPPELTVATLVGAAFLLTLAVSLYVSEGGADVVRIDGVVTKLNEEIEQLKEEAEDLRKRENPGPRLAEVYVAIDECRNRRRKYLAIRTDVMVKRARLTRLEEEYDRLELKEIDERKEVKRPVKRKRKR